MVDSHVAGGPSEAVIIRKSDLRAQPWKNGGGITRQIWSALEDDTLLWRLSLADVTSDGPFSIFPNMMRVLTVVEGEGMDLHSADHVLAAHPVRPISFDGAEPVDGRLRAGKVVNFNLIHNAQSYTSVATTMTGPSLVLPGVSRSLHILHCVTGGVTISGSDILRPGDTALVPAAHVLPEIHASGSCLVLTLTDQSDARSSFIAPR
jgi:environmental stress-induced protein Ves